MFNSRRLIGNATVSVIQALISGLVLFFLYRYVIAYLGLEKLGLWSVVLASTSVARLSDMGLTGSVLKFVARYRARNDDGQAAEVVQTAVISIALAMAVIIFAVYPFLDNVLTLAIPEESMPQALRLLPWAVLSLWLGSVASVFQSGLDGCQRMDIRNILMIIGNLLFFVAALWLIPRYGLDGLAIGQAGQGLFLILASWAMLRRQIISLPWVPVHWSKVKFKEMFSYAVNFQINTIAILLFEPVIKLLMSRYGGLSSAGFYEMSSQLVTRLRALIIAASQALTPAVADLHEIAPEKNRGLYLKSYSILFFCVIPFYGAILISLPLVSVLWIGQLESQFLLFGMWLIAGWAMNTLAGPAYFFNLGTGDLGWNSVAHVSMAILNVLLGSYLGQRFGALGVVIGSMIALIFASLFILFFFHKKQKISFWNLVPKDHLILFPPAVFCIIFSAWAYKTNWFFDNVFLGGWIGISLYLLLISAAIWSHSYRTKLIKFVRKYVFNGNSKTLSYFKRD
ncbi:lipopolysaccharide biosynthesis protein [SAR92 clade bacterium H231]|nr:lipopolysaccharide biosynthesis protein [SAR92 clade bacterium H231]